MIYSMGKENKSAFEISILLNGNLYLKHLYILVFLNFFQPKWITKMLFIIAVVVVFLVDFEASLDCLVVVLRNNLNKKNS